MFCSKCGTKNAVSAKFCKNCGDPINKADYSYAGFGIRFGAYFADFIGAILLAVLFGVIEYAVASTEILSKIGILGDYLVWVVYSTFFLSIWSSTPGKMLYGLRVEKENGDSLDFGTAFKRALLQPLSFVFFGAGFWNMGKNDKQQAWHDKQANTIVVGEKKRNYIIQIIISALGFILYAYLRSLPGGQ